MIFALVGHALGRPTEFEDESAEVLEDDYRRIIIFPYINRPILYSFPTYSLILAESMTKFLPNFSKMVMYSVNRSRCMLFLVLI